MIHKDQLRAVKIAKKILTLLPQWLKEGIKEKEIADRILGELKKCHAQPAFRIIVASGKRSAKPHGFATSKKIKKGELVVVDFGAKYNGYRSDLTRTFVIGKPAKKQVEVIKIVKEAQRRAISAVKAGVECRKVDSAAREYIERQGFGKYFIHSTGHGIKRKTHEPPKISRKNRNRLRVGQVITIEPGIYIKNWGGVRIEDMLLVTKQGYKVLTR